MHISDRAFAPRLAHRRAFAPSALMAIDGAPPALNGAPSARHLNPESLADAARCAEAEAGVDSEAVEPQ